jgi:PDZ domain-containing secreted protein
MVWPAAVTVVGVELFTTVSAGRDVAGTVNGLDGDVTVGPVGGVPVAVAASATEPLFMSAWVTT